MRPGTLLALLALLAVSLLGGLAGCGISQHIHIDWVNFIRFQGIEYVASYHGEREMQPADLGAQFATVRANVNTSSCQAQDGCASYSEPGTPVYRVAGYASTFRLAVYQGDRIVLFEADTNPHAKTGADLLDIGGKVQSITIIGDSGTATTPLATIADARQVATLLALLLAAPVDQTRQSASDGPRYFLTFHLADGTATTRLYVPGDHEVARGIIVPDAFVSLMSSALGK